MLLLLLICLMKFVDMSTLNRPRRYYGGSISSTNATSSESDISSDSTKENYHSQNGQQLYKLQQQKHRQQQRMLLYQQQRQQLEQQLQQLTPQQYQKLQLHQLQQQQKFELLEQQQQKSRQLQQLQLHKQQQIPQILQNDKNLQENIIFKGLKSHRGMTEHLTNELPTSPHKSRLPQLNHNNYNLSHHYQQTNNTSNTSVIQPQSTYKRPLTSPNTTTAFNLNNYYHHNGISTIPYNKINTTNLNNKPYTTNYNSSGGSINGLGCSISDDDELTDEHLKRNVEIVLNNIDRYNSTLRSIILNEQINSLALSYNNNDTGAVAAATATVIDSTIDDCCANNIMASANILSSPDQADYNSNPSSVGLHFNHHHQQHHLPYIGNSYCGNSINSGVNFNGHLNCSIASSSHDFTHDNSDYQWFLDYGYRDGVAHQSVLSSLSESYNGIGELSYYEDLAKNIDANLAEVDMENFRTEDIHSLLTHLPSFCKVNNSIGDDCSNNIGINDGLFFGNKHHYRQQHNSDIDNSICKSELLFSPVKETQHISTDSLDLDGYPDDGDIILTCQANKDNYTIAFEGSVLYSDESFYAEPNDITIRNKQNFINLHSNLDDIVKRKSLEVSMCRSDNAFTTWSKLKKNSTLQLQRYPSGNNNTSVNIITRHSPHCIVRKSSSLPNLRIQNGNPRQLNVSQAISTSTVESSKLRNLLPMCQMPISTTSVDEISPDNTGSSSNNMHTTESLSATKQQHQLQQNNQPAFNLVKLFIKQKSSSSDTCMDVSSGCWPSSEASSSLENQQQRCRKKSMTDSGKGSALSRQAEEDQMNTVIAGNNIGENATTTTTDSSFQLDSLDTYDQTSILTNKDSLNTTPKKIVKTDLYREVFGDTRKNQQQQQQQQQLPLRNPQIYNLTVHNNNNNNNNSLSSDASRTSENLTQIYCNNNSRMKLPSDVVTRSIQTSILLKDRLRFVPPSFLAKLNKLGGSNGSNGCEKSAPVYVIYPNYSLPDLGFVKNNLSDVVLSPFIYKTTLAAAVTTTKKQRPTSLTKSDEEILKNINYKEITDWKSLVTLLPIEYRKRLKHIPEADIELDPECSMKPMFCMTPPLRRNPGTTKASLCDCAMYIQQQNQQQQQCTTSTSGSSQQPSSGYRGSSTLLTDSEFDPPTLTSTPPLNFNDDTTLKNNLFVYQYDNNRIDSEILQQEKLPPSGRTPRGILRRNLRSSTGNNNSAACRSKRNSMFEEENSNIRNLEKRRSLQDPQYYMNEDIIEEYLGEATEEDKLKQYYDELSKNLKLNKTEINYMMDECNVTRTDRKSRRDYDMDARARAENFLSNVPKAELKFYAEIASILECSETNDENLHYDAAKLKNEVSRALSQKRVSFNQIHHQHLNVGGTNQKFSTPPNSPNISMAALKVNNNVGGVGNNSRKTKEISLAEKERQNKISSNRFKRLQIQWELLSKDSSMMLKDLASEKETKSGGSTPTSSSGHRSRIPRPVSYPASKPTSADTRTLQSPSRIVPPKKYNGVPSLGNASGKTATTTTTINGPSLGNARSRTPSSTNNRTPANNSNTTPKRRVQSPRAAPRTR